nr:putative peroxiredoxin [uncultured bacterium]
MLEIGQSAPEFQLADDQGGSFTLASRRGSRVLLVFYPGDNTPVCTRQLCDYRDGIEAFSELGVEVVGISSDGIDSHQGFREKHKLPFVLLSDGDLTVAAQYDCKGMLGMKRGVFLVDEQGLLQYVHVEALAVFRRSSAELIDVIRALDGKTGDAA